MADDWHCSSCGGNLCSGCGYCCSCERCHCNGRSETWKTLNGIVSTVLALCVLGAGGVLRVMGATVTQIQTS